MRQKLTSKEWETFETQGFVRLGKVVDNHELDTLRVRINEIMMGPAQVPYDLMMMQLDSKTGGYKDMPKQTLGHKGATLAYRKIQGLEFDPLFLNYLQKPLFLNICERAYGKGIPFSIFRAMFMNKPAGKGTVLPWHQDNFPGVDKPPFITVWMALDDSKVENGCVKVLPGSHHQFEINDPTVFLNQEQINEVLPRYSDEMLECKAGEGFLLHNFLLHSSEVNSTTEPRRAFSVCYMNGRSTSIKDHTGFPIAFGEGALVPKSIG